MALIPPSERRELLELARAALEARVTGVPAAHLPHLSHPPSLLRSYGKASPSHLSHLSHLNCDGVFVTIHHRGELRGCLGTVDAPDSLTEEIARLAGDVADRDHRFAPLTAAELPEVEIELSVLTTPTFVDDPTTIVVGRDGLIVEDRNHRGLLLPQVAVEHGWDRDTFLAQTCVKAGLPRDAWKRGATVWRFEAEVFNEPMADSRRSPIDGS